VRHHGLGYTFLAEMSEQQKDASHSLFTGVEQLVDQIFFVTDIARQQIRHEHVGKRVFAVKCIHHRFFVYAQKSQSVIAAAAPMRRT
jgi:hypothetical protein